jgi:hypothetical protein
MTDLEIPAGQNKARRRPAVILAAACVLAAGAMDVARAEPGPCVLSDDEAVLLEETSDQVARWPGPGDYVDVESRVPSLGCGVWILSVGKDGSVKTVRLLRSDAQGAFFETTKLMLLKIRYRASRRDWTGLVKITLKRDGE